MEGEEFLPSDSVNKKGQGNKGETIFQGEKERKNTGNQGRGSRIVNKHGEMKAMQRIVGNSL
jgi:hypothetical protein